MIKDLGLTHLEMSCKGCKHTIQFDEEDLVNSLPYRDFPFKYDEMYTKIYSNKGNAKIIKNKTLVGYTKCYADVYDKFIYCPNCREKIIYEDLLSVDDNYQVKYQFYDKNKKRFTMDSQELKNFLNKVKNCKLEPFEGDLY